MPRQFRRSRGRRIGDAVLGLFVRAGLVPSTYMLTTTAGRVHLARLGDFTVRELTAVEAGPVLKRYVAVATATRPYFEADKDAPPEAFAAEADRHPTFELLPLR